VASPPNTASERSPSTKAQTPPCDLKDSASSGDRSLTQQLHWNSSSSSSPTSAEHADIDSELAQTYLEHVAPSFTGSYTPLKKSWIWHIFVPAQALVSSAIRHGLLASAAVYSHLRAQEEGKAPSPKFLEVATSYGSAFVEQSRAQLHKLEPQHVNTNLAATRLLCVLAFAFHRCERANNENQEMSWTWIHLLKGLNTTHESLLRSGQAIQPRLLHDFLPRSLGADIDSPNLHESSAASGQSGNTLLYISRTRSARFATLRFAHSQGWLGFDSTEPDTLSTAIDNLSRITDLICAGQYKSLFRALFSWIADLDTAVVQRLTDGHPGTLAVYAHWLMLLVLAEDLWWIGDMGRAGIRDVLHVIGELTNDLAPVLSWPREMLCEI
jgi:hypothetical protein